MRKINSDGKNSPNIILIFLDCVRAQNLPFYGYCLNTMPNLNKIINEFIVFPDAISSNNWTLPAVASTLTGTYLSEHGLVFDGDILSSKLITLPEYLFNNGYETLLFSSHPYLSEFSGLNRGFSRQFNNTPLNGFRIYEIFYRLMKSIKSKITAKKSSQNSGERHFSEPAHRRRKLSKFNLFWRWYLTYFSDRDAQYKVKKFIKWFKRDRNTNRNYFALFHFFETHTPYIVPCKYRKKYIDTSIDKKKFWKVPQGLAYPKDYGMTAEDFRINEGIYNGAIGYLDRILFKLISFLKKTDHWQNTVLVMTSDHGENLGEHGLMYHKFVLYDTLIKIPMVLKLPRDFQILNDHQVVQNVDIFPTIVDILGKYDERVRSQFMGNSLVSGNIKKRENYFAISELLKPWQNPPSSPDNLPEDLKKYWGRYIISYRTKDFKYIHSSKGDHEYYDLVKDNNEENNIINKVAEDHLEEIKKSLKPYLASLKQKAVLYQDRIIGKKKIDPTDINKDIIESLQSLGYL
jgi:arylsulfatase A-like enzyme